LLIHPVLRPQEALRQPEEQKRQEALRQQQEEQQRLIEEKRRLEAEAREAKAQESPRKKQLWIYPVFRPGRPLPPAMDIACSNIFTSIRSSR
jgi:hypothetical protein